MNQRELNRSVAKATGEDISTIARRGFVPLTPFPVEHEPTFIDWNELDANRGVSLLPQRSRRQLAAA